MLLYLCLKAIARIALRIFFRRFNVRNPQQFLRQGPLILVANHPNTFMDPLVPASLLAQRAAFVANGSIFNRFSRPIFDYLHVIPVYRKQDKVAATLSPSELNKFTFQRCYDYLTNGGTLLIFPEGTSELERRLREIKTGAARIALGAEAEHDFGLGVKIVPVGINYTDPTRFRSDVFVNVGTPIEVADFKDLYHPGTFEAVEALTELIQKRLSELVIVTEDEAEDTVVRHVEQLYKNQLLEDFRETDTTQTAAHFDLIQQIVQAVRYFEKQRPTFFKPLQIKMANYLDNLKTLGLSDEVLGQSRRFSAQILRHIFVLIVGLPFFFYGFLNNYLPYILPSCFANKISSDRGYRAPIMMTLGIFIFPIFYGFQLYAVQYFGQNYALTALYALSLPIGGFFVLWYWPFTKRFKNAWQARRLFHKKPSLLGSLLAERQAIFGQLDTAKKEYLSVTGPK